MVSYSSVTILKVVIMPNTANASRHKEKQNCQIKRLVVHTNIIAGGLA